MVVVQHFSIIQSPYPVLQVFELLVQFSPMDGDRSAGTDTGTAPPRRGMHGSDLDYVADR
jgi:hypothetical protein